MLGTNKEHIHSCSIPFNSIAMNTGRGPAMVIVTGTFSLLISVSAKSDQTMLHLKECQGVVYFLSMLSSALYIADTGCPVSTAGSLVGGNAASL